MSARIPLDVDLEDRLLYGLTPTHLAYMVVALMAAFAAWSSHWAPSPVRATVCVLVVGVGAAVAWGRWRGRSTDAWMLDAAMFAMRTQRITWNKTLVRRFARGGAKHPLEPELQTAALEPEAVAAAA